MKTSLSRICNCPVEVTFSRDPVFSLERNATVSTRGGKPVQYMTIRGDEEASGYSCGWGDTRYERSNASQSHELVNQDQNSQLESVLYNARRSYCVLCEAEF